MGSGKLFGGASGAASGVATGSALGPVGALVGAGLGGTLGVIGASTDKRGKTTYKPLKLPTYDDIINSDTYRNSYQNTLNSLNSQINSSKQLDSKNLTNQLNAQNQLGSSYENTQRGLLDQQYGQNYAQADQAAKQTALNSYKDQANAAIRPYLGNLGQGSSSASYSPANSSSSGSGNSFGSLLNYLTLGNVLQSKGTSSLSQRRFF